MKTIKLKISGMSCAACSSSIERSLRRKAIINKIEVDLIRESALIEYDDTNGSIDNIIKLIEKLGYKAEIPTSLSCKKQINNDYLIAIIFAIPLFIISMGGMFFNAIIFHNTKLIFIIEILLLIPILYAGRKIYIKGFNSLIKLVPNMDSLVMLGSGSAIIYSLYIANFSNQNFLHNLYFESAGVIIAIIMLGKKLESNATNNAKNALDSITNISPKIALKLVNNETIQTKIEYIEIGDIIVIPKGEMFSVDCILQSDKCIVDESIITGESKHKIKQKGNLIYSGSINESEQVEAVAYAKANDSMIGKIISLMQNTKKAPIARIADKISAYFVPSIIFIAIIASGVWFYIKGDFHISFIVFTSTLLISCPCALGLATPLSIIIATSIASKRGFYFKNAESLENASKINTIVFDKTGTLTTGELEVVEFEILDSKYTKNYLLSLIYAIESKSEHIISNAILKYIKKEVKTTNFNVTSIESIPGKGISGIIDNKEIKIGNITFINNAIAREIPYIVCYIGIDNKYCANFVITDKLNQNTKEMVAKLKKLNIKSIILSGDAKANVESIANICKIDEYYYSQLPQDKLDFINKLQENGNIVGFVGDGINDVLAIKQADIGISLSNASDIAIKQADIILLNSNLNSIYEALMLSSKTIKNIKENLTFAFIYNICAIPIAMGIPAIFGINLTLNPMIAGLAMGLSSISVVLNSMRLYKFKKFID
ncbi:cation-translocating P-type ATPase [Helicobacter sp. MIT 14-3879]|uniref:heavy metal translocating P-type ATPase n=1 Tax=Helicobacter sp. MIT 14-3879 TaxID=2040649 RepID=UPI000E1ED0BA|nr:cation-translocating P-type ATPase [Helicobacter sp. MIT 14-3879]RDU65158.1 cadmium-translocating P-type ATPase [Helicobacter sp. MIT 14-3879]